MYIFLSLKYKIEGNWILRATKLWQQIWLKSWVLDAYYFLMPFLSQITVFFMCHQISKDTIIACQGISFKSWMTPKYIWKPFLLKRGKRSKTLKVFKIESESPKEVKDGWMEKKVNYVNLVLECSHTYKCLSS